MVCRRCGTVLPADWPVCMDCGAAADAPPAAASGADDAEEVFPLLAAANLARRRGNLPEAERQCRDLAARYPESAAVHSLFGEVYEEMNRLEDARACYQLALQIQPNNQGDRDRLDRVIQRIQSGTGARKGASAGPRSMGTLFIGRASFHPGWAAAVGLGLLCLGLAIALLALTGSHTVVRPEVAGAAGESSQEAMIRASMSKALHPGGPPITITGVRVDPRSRTPYALITAALTSPIAPGTGRDICVQAAAEVAQSAVAANLNWATVRVVGPPTGGGSSLLFVADLAPGGFISVDASALTAASAGERFQNPWWNPTLP